MQEKGLSGMAVLFVILTNFVAAALVKFTIPAALSKNWEKYLSKS
ncbi:hypothetical protein [Ruminococcus sp.]|nr:hypothetical protein [Ruminococcus sp.]